MIDHLILTMPLRTVSEQNVRQHWSVRNRRKVKQQEEVMVEWRNKAGLQKFKLPCRVTFTRYSVKLMDTDAIVSSFKGVRDMVAALLNVDDGPESPVEWHYLQEKIAKREHGIKIEVQSV
jgi:hypothetical protein